MGNSRKSIKGGLPPKQRDLHIFLKTTHFSLKLGDTINNVVEAIKAASANGEILDINDFAEQLIKENKLDYSDELRTRIRNVISEITGIGLAPANLDIAATNISTSRTTPPPAKITKDFKPKERWTPDAPPALPTLDITPKTNAKSAVDAIIEKYSKFNLEHARPTMVALEASWQQRQRLIIQRKSIDEIEVTIKDHRNKLKETINEIDPTGILFYQIDSAIRISNYNAGASKTSNAREV